MVKAPIRKLSRAGLVRSAGPAADVRPNGRIRWQQEQKEETRGRLLKAAAKAFAAQSYAVTSVEDIVTLAEVGRTSFYRHFTSP